MITTIIGSIILCIASCQKITIIDSLSNYEIIETYEIVDNIDATDTTRTDKPIEDKYIDEDDVKIPISFEVSVDDWDEQDDINL